MNIKKPYPPDIADRAIRIIYYNNGLKAIFYTEVNI